MKKHFLFLTFVLLVANLSGQVVAGSVVAVDKVIDKRVGEWLDEASEKLEILRAKAIDDANLAAEQRLLQIQLILENLTGQLSSDLDAKINVLDQNIVGYISQVDLIIKDAARDISVLAQRLDLLVNTSLNDLCAKLAICKNDKITYSIRYINNTTITPGISAEYHRIEIGGTAINNTANISVFVNDVQIPNSEITADIENAKNVRIPNSLLQFKDYEINRLELRIVVSDKILNPNRNWWNVSEDKIVSDTTIDLNSSLLLMPIYPLRIEIIEHGLEKMWKDCPNCRTTYKGSTSFNRISEHKLELSPGYRLKRVITLPEERLDVAGDDYYYMYCQYPKEIIRENGKVYIYSRCFDAAINISCHQIAYDYYRSTDRNIRDKLIDAQYPCWVIPKTNREVFYEVELQRLEEVPVDKARSISVSEAQVKDGYLGYGDHWSGNLLSPRSGFSIKVSPTFGNNDKDYLILTPSTPRKKITGILTINSLIEKNGNQSRLKISVKPELH